MYISQTPLSRISSGARGGAVVEALCYRLEGRGFDSRIDILPPHYGPGVDSVSSTNEYQEYFLRSKGGRCVGLTTLPPSCADFHEIGNPEPGTLRTCPGLYRD